MNQINIKEYFKTEKEKLRLAVIEPPSLTIVDATSAIKKKIGVDEKLSRSQGIVIGNIGAAILDLETEFERARIMEVKGRFAVPGLFEYNYMVFNRVLS